LIWISEKQKYFFGGGWTENSRTARRANQIESFQQITPALHRRQKHYFGFSTGKLRHADAPGPSKRLCPWFRSHAWLLDDREAASIDGCFHFERAPFGTYVGGLRKCPFIRVPALPVEVQNGAPKRI
jgi:hypothetical protein